MSIQDTIFSESLLFVYNFQKTRNVNRCSSQKIASIFASGIKRSSTFHRILIPPISTSLTQDSTISVRSHYMATGTTSIQRISYPSMRRDAHALTVMVLVGRSVVEGLLVKYAAERRSAGEMRERRSVATSSSAEYPIARSSAGETGETRAAVEGNHRAEGHSAGVVGDSGVSACRAKAAKAGTTRGALLDETRVKDCLGYSLVGYSSEDLLRVPTAGPLVPCF